MIIYCVTRVQETWEENKFSKTTNVSVIVSKIHVRVVPEIQSAWPTDTTEPEVCPQPDGPTLEMRNNGHEDTNSEISVGSVAASDVSPTSRSSKRKRARK